MRGRARRTTSGSPAHRWSVVMAAAVAAAAIGATVGTAQPATLYCVNGAATTLPTTITFSGGSRVLTSGIAENIVANSFDHATFYLGFSSSGAGPFFWIPGPTFDPATALASGYSRNTVAPGACAVHVPVPGAAFMCAAGYGASSSVDYVAGRETVGAYLAGDAGRRYASFVLDDLGGGQRAQPVGSAPPAGSFYCAFPAGLRVEPILGSDGRQLLADTQGTLYPSEYANLETIGHPAFRVIG